MAPSPHGVSTRRPAAARRATSTAGAARSVTILAALGEERMVDPVAALDAEARHRAAVELEHGEDRLVAANRLRRQPHPALLDGEPHAVGGGEQQCEGEQG